VDLLSEEEQWESLKRWLRQNGAFIAVLVILGLGAVYGWRWWNSRDDGKALAASAAYQEILNSYDANKIEAAVAQTESLRTTYPKSVYVTAADLAAARVFVSRNELDKAAQRLERVANTGVDELIRPVARLRLARVQAAQGKYDVALATLGTADMGVHQPAYAEARGDVLLAKGDRAGALRNYQAARKLQPVAEEGAESGVAELLDLKIADVSAAASAVATEKP
jgi:predicted negative regulator of RcsB-dependent stress response